MTDWNDVHVFLAVCRTGSFVRAASALGLDASTVSRRIAALERALACSLFQRSTRALTMTDRARRLQPHAETIERTMVALRRDAADPDEARGRVRVAAPEEIVGGALVPALGALLGEHAEIEVELVGAGHVADLERGEADLAIRVVRPEKGELLARRVAKVRYRPYAARSYLRGRSLDDPATLDWLALDDPAERAPEARWVSSVRGARGPRLKTNDTRDLAVAAAAGLGAAVLPEAIAARHPELEALWPETSPVVQRSLWLVIPRRLATRASVRIVARWVESTCRAALDA